MFHTIVGFTALVNRLSLQSVQRVTTPKPNKKNLQTEIKNEVENSEKAVSTVHHRNCKQKKLKFTLTTSL